MPAKRSALAAAVTLIGVCTAADPAGTWLVSMQTPVGEQTNELTITATADGHTATIASEHGTRDLDGVQVDGDSVDFVARISTPSGDMELRYHATVDGDEMKGTATTMRGDRPFTGVRK